MNYRFNLINYKNNIFFNNIFNITASCNLNKKINVLNIYNNIKLNNSDILCIKINNQKYKNNITIITRINYTNINKLILEPKVQIKLFSNGLIYMYGYNMLCIENSLNNILFKIIEIENYDINNVIINNFRLISYST